VNVFCIAFLRSISGIHHRPVELSATECTLGNKSHAQAQFKFQRESGTAFLAKPEEDCRLRRLACADGIRDIMAGLSR